MTRNSEGCGDLNVTTASWADERELVEDLWVMESPITYAAAAAKASLAATEVGSEEVERHSRKYRSLPLQQQTTREWQIFKVDFNAIFVILYTGAEVNLQMYRYLCQTCLPVIIMKTYFYVIVLL